MIDVKGNRNFVITRGDTFEFAFKSNFMNLIDKVTLVCPKLGLTKDFVVYEFTYYLRLSPAETLSLDPEVKAVNYMIQLKMKAGTVKTLFIDGVLELINGSNTEPTSDPEGAYSELDVTEEYDLTPSFTVNLFDWVRVQIPTMIHVQELPEPSADTYYNFYYRETDSSIWVTTHYFDEETGEECFAWDRISREGETVQKLNIPNQVYTTDDEGNDSSIEYAVDFLAGSIPVRDSLGNLKVPTTPTEENDAASKAYVDDHSPLIINTPVEPVTDFSDIKRLYRSIDGEIISFDLHLPSSDITKSRASGSDCRFGGENLYCFDGIGGCFYTKTITDKNLAASDVFLFRVIDDPDIKGYPYSWYINEGYTDDELELCLVSESGTFTHDFEVVNIQFTPILPENASNLQQPKYFYTPAIDAEADVITEKGGDSVVLATIPNYFIDYDEVFTEFTVCENIYTNKISVTKTIQGDINTIDLSDMPGKEGPLIDYIFTRSSGNDFSVGENNYYAFYSESEDHYVYINNLRPENIQISDIYYLETPDGEGRGSCIADLAADYGIEPGEEVHVPVNEVNPNLFIVSIDHDSEQVTVTTDVLRIGTASKQGALSFKPRGTSTRVRVGKYYYVSTASGHEGELIYDSGAQVAINGTLYTFSSDSEILDIEVTDPTVVITNSGGRIFLYSVSTFADPVSEWRPDNLDTIRERKEYVDNVEQNLKSVYIEPLQTTVAEHGLRLDSLDGDIARIDGLIDDINDNIGAIQIDNINNLPTPGYNYLNKFYRSNGVLYQCLKTSNASSDEYVWSFENVTGTAEVNTDAKWEVFANEVTGDFADYVSAESYAKFYRNNGNIKLGSSSYVGSLGLRISLENITKIEIVWAAYTATKTSEFIVELDGEKVYDQLKKGNEGQQTVTLRDLGGLSNPSLVLSSGEAEGVNEKRVLIYAIRVYTGSDDIYEWVPFIDGHSDQYIRGKKSFRHLGISIPGDGEDSYSDYAFRNGLVFEYNVDNDDFELILNRDDVNSNNESHDTIVNIDPNTGNIDIQSDLTVQSPETSMSATPKSYVDALKPKTRLVTITSADWTNGSYTITLSGVEIGSNDVVFVFPDDASASDYYNAGITRSISNNSIVLNAAVAPSNTIRVQVIYMKGEAL